MQRQGAGGVALPSCDPPSLIPWQARFKRGVSRPTVRTAALSVARSNGKSHLAARLAVDYLMSDRRDSEAVIVASSYGQAKIIFRYALAMVRDRGLEPSDRTAWWYRDSVTTALLRSRATGQAIRALGCDPKRAHGRVFGLALLDEPGQWPGSRDEMLAALTTGAGKVEEPKVVALGTRPATADHWFARWLGGEADYVQCHAARPTDPPFQLRTIRRANPSYDRLAPLRADLLAQRDKARRGEADRAAYMSLALNLGVPDTVESVLIDPEAWTRCEVDTLPPAEGGYALGIDLGSGAAMSAAAAYFAATSRLEALAVFGGLPDLVERGRADQVGTAYERMASRGELLVQAGRRVPDVGEFLRVALNRWGVPSCIVADRWREHELRDALEASGVPPCPLILRGQGWKDGAADVRAFRRAVLEGKVRARPSLLIRSALAEARTLSDPAGNQKLSKGSQGGRRQRARDDVAAAAILAVAEGSRRYREPVAAPEPVEAVIEPVSRRGMRFFGPGAAPNGV